MRKHSGKLQFWNLLYPHDSFGSVGQWKIVVYIQRAHFSSLAGDSACCIGDAAHLADVVVDDEKNPDCQAARALI